MQKQSSIPFSTGSPSPITDRINNSQNSSPLAALIIGSALSAMILLTIVVSVTVVLIFIYLRRKNKRSDKFNVLSTCNPSKHHQPENEPLTNPVYGGKVTIRQYQI